MNFSQPQRHLEAYFGLELVHIVTKDVPDRLLVDAGVLAESGKGSSRMLRSALVALIALLFL
jgi:hypothetical protein